MALDATLATGVLVSMMASSFIDPHGENGATWGAHTPNTLSLTLMVLSAAALVLRRRAPGRSSSPQAPSPPWNWWPATPGPRW